MTNVDRATTVAVSLALFGAVAVAIAAVLALWGSPQPVSAGTPAGATLYGTAYQGSDGAATLYTIDPATGEATSVGPIGFERCGGMDFDSSGTLYATCEPLSNGGAGVSSSGLVPDEPVLVTIDPATGEGTQVGPLGLGALDVFDVSFRNSDDQLFFSYAGGGPTAAGANGGGCVYLGTIDTSTGAGSLVGDTGTCDPGNGLAFSPGDILYFTNVTPTLYTLNQSDGQATDVANHIFDQCGETNGVSAAGEGGGNRINAMEFQPGTGVLFASHNAGSGGTGPNCLSTVNPTTAAVTVVGQSVNGLDALAFLVQEGADLEITKTAAPDKVDVGEELTYTITATNNGPATATNVQVTDDLPESVEFVSVSTTAGTCSESGGTVTCELGDLSNGATATIEVVVTPTKEGDLENTATVASDQTDPDSADNTAVAGFVVGAEAQPTPAELPDTGSQPAGGDSGFPWLIAIAGGAALLAAGGWWLARRPTR